MTNQLILASGSEIRAQLLRDANVPFRVVTKPVDEAAIRESMVAQCEAPREIVDALAEAKARRVGMQEENFLVLGSDQIIVFEDKIIGKPSSEAELFEQLRAMARKSHKLLCAAVIYHQARPIWRHVSEATMWMRDVSDAYLQDYITRNWSDLRHCAGGYMIEREGARLFHRVQGDHFAILGLPLIEILNFLTERGEIPG